LARPANQAQQIEPSVGPATESQQQIDSSKLYTNKLMHAQKSTPVLFTPTTARPVMSAQVAVQDDTA
jgi:hypothetical protein